MTLNPEWYQHVCEAVGKIKNRYEHIGRKTGAPFLALVYPPEIEADVFREWDAQSQSLKDDFHIKNLDLLDLTQEVNADIGLETILDTIGNPSPGSNPEQELGNLWLTKIVDTVRSAFQDEKTARPVVVLKRLAALYPITGPQMVMQRLWDNSHDSLNGPVVLLIPGTLTDSRRYLFLNLVDEYMYRGDIL